MTAERVLVGLLLGLLLGGIALGCFVVLSPFFSALLWAAILVFTTWPVAEWLRERCRLRRGAAAGLMVALTAVIVVLPLALAAPGSAADVNHLRALLENWLRGGLPAAPDWLAATPLVGRSLAELWNQWSADLSAVGDTFRPYFGLIAEAAVSLLLGIAGGVVGFGFALFIAFFFYVHGEPLALRLRVLLGRIAGDRAERLIAVTGATVRGVVYGILGTAVIQGILTGFGLWVCGVPRPLLLGALAGFLAVLPIGAPLVWIPAALWLMSRHELAWGIGLAVYGVVAVSGSDSVLRPLFISRGARLPFLLTVLGVLGGAVAFGLLGVFLGPVLLGVGYTLVMEFARPEIDRPESPAPLTQAETAS